MNLLGHVNRGCGLSVEDPQAADQRHLEYLSWLMEEGNGCAERFIRTLKEHLLWIEPFDTAEALRLALLAFKDRYNREWLIERDGHQTPAAVRAAFAADVAA
jgi:transposase InsO family protein